MKDYFKNVLWVLAAVALAAAVGWSIEWFRRRNLRNWAREQGGTFEPGGILASVTIPEAAAFDVGAGSYNNVTRIVTPEATYVLATSYHSYQDIKDRQHSSSNVVCFIVRPTELPAADIFPTVHGLGRFLGLVKTASGSMPGATPAFAAAFTATGDPPALPPAVQEDLLANTTLIAGLQFRGRVVRVQAVEQRARYPHADVYAFSRRLVAAWPR